MKYRYGYSENGKLVKIAKIYTRDEHNLSKKDIDYSVFSVLRTLVSRGHVAYIVGGAIRDIFAGLKPKDFDIVTNAHPQQVKKYFRSAQIIGKRFPIVLVRTGRYEQIEVTTFRGIEEKKEPSVAHRLENKRRRRSVHSAIEETEFGTIEQDVLRRDFTCNALYYDADREEVIDFVDGVKHIKERKLIPVRTEFEEDPVRMVRAVKYSRKLDLNMPFKLKRNISKHVHRLDSVASSRISDEIMKILISGVSESIVRDLFDFKLMKYMLPDMYVWYVHDKSRMQRLFAKLAEADRQVEKRYSRIRGLQMLLYEFVMEEAQSILKEKKQQGSKNANLITRANLNQILGVVKKWIQPITPPNIELEKAIMSSLSSEGLLASHSKQSRASMVSKSSKSRRPSAEK